jgi:hypothetical protein
VSNRRFGTCDPDEAARAEAIRCSRPPFMFDPLLPIIRSTSALAAEIDGEVVALDVERGVCFGLNASGSRVWSLLGAPTTGRAICQSMSEMYDVDRAVCEREVLALLEDLAAEGLIQPASASATA